MTNNASLRTIEFSYVKYYTVTEHFYDIKVKQSLHMFGGSVEIY
jgi:hypothetical protein